VRRIFEETLTSPNPNQNSTAQWHFFSSNNSAPANKKKGFYADHNPNKQLRLDLFFYEAAQNLEVFSNIQK
jgi:hypothetical protein